MENTTELNELCQVCGDVACAINHRAWTCHSCRMFFRRHASRLTKFKCLKSGNCHISYQTRTSCQACRLKKCFAIGMKLKRIPETRPRKIYTKNCRIILDDFIANELKRLPADVEVNRAAPTVTTLPDALFHQLNEHEQSLVNEVEQAMTVFVDENNLKVIGSKQSSIDVLNMLSLYARRIVKFCKSIETFRQLPIEDQLIILKPFYFEIIVIRVAYLYDEEKNGFPLFQSELADSVVYVHLQNRRTANVRQNKRFIKILHDEMEGDSTIRDLIIAQALFKPRDNLSRPEWIRYQYMLYTMLLRRYLETKYGDCTLASTKFYSLVDLNKDFCMMRDKVLAYVKTVDINQITDLMAEVFDIK